MWHCVHVRMCMHVAWVFSLQGKMFITAEVRMMTAVVKIKHRRKDTDHTSPGGSVCACVLWLWVLMCVCLLLQANIFLQKDGIFSCRLLKSLKIYRTEEFAIFVRQGLLLIGGAPGCLQAIGKCAWMWNIFVSTCVYDTVVDAETRNIRFRLPQRGQRGELAVLSPPLLTHKATAGFGIFQHWKLNQVAGIKHAMATKQNNVSSTEQ